MLGSWADWSTTIIAFLALMVAGLAAKATIQTNRAQQETLELQRKQFEAAQDQLERAQASQVAFHIGPVSETDNSSAAYVINASNVPISMIAIVEAVLPDAPAARILYVADYLWPTGQSPAVWTLDPSPLFPDPAFRMYFTDAAGVDWLRDQAILRKRTHADNVDAMLKAYSDEREARRDSAGD
jgi:hypothetical protein